MIDVASGFGIGGVNVCIVKVTSRLGRERSTYSDITIEEIVEIFWVREVEVVVMEGLEKVTAAEQV